MQNNQIDYDSAEIVWGGVGCGVQHSFMQMLHQGSQIVPVDFLVAVNNREFLVANCLAQSQALMQGTNHTLNEVKLLHRELDKFKQCFGNRPSSTILFRNLTPEVLGGLIALYEHKTFVQGVMWNINSFDQYGVELGKNLANEVLMQLDPEEIKSGLDIQSSDDNLLKKSMIGLINKYYKFKNNIS